MMRPTSKWFFVIAALPHLGSAFFPPMIPLPATQRHDAAAPSSTRTGDIMAAVVSSPPTSTSLSSSRRTTTSEELIPRDILFGNPEYSSPLLSPDGMNLAYLAPSPDGVMNVWIRDLSGPLHGGDDDGKEGDRMITNEPKRAIRSVAWAYDSRTILFMNDEDGDENFHLFATDALSSVEEGIIPPVRDLTPGKDVKAQNIFTNYRYPDQILVGTNERDPKVFDMYRIFHETGEKYLDTMNPGDVIGWKTEDESFEIRAAVSRYGNLSNPGCPSHLVECERTSGERCRYL